MTLRDALDDYKRFADDGTAFPGERRSPWGLFSGRDGRLVHVDPDGRLRDFGYPLTGLSGLARSRLGVRRDGEVTWFDDCETRSQTYYNDTALVVTEHVTDAGVVTQYDLTLGDAHLTRVVPGDGVEVVAFLGFAPDAQDTRIGQLRHDDAVEVYHADEHDFVASATGLADVRGELPATFAELLDDDPVEFPREVAGARHEEPRLSGDLVCRIPTDDSAATVATLLTDRTETSREGALARLEALLESHDSGEALERAAEAQVAIRPDSPVPESDAVAADLRVLDLLSAPTGLRIAGPDFDPFYAYSGGYGYTWFRDDAEIAGFLLEADRHFDLGLGDWHASAARAYCNIQREDGTWPHRVWPRDGTLAPGWANGRLETGDGVGYQADQTASVVAFLARYHDDADGDLASPIAAAVERGLDGLDATLASDGRPAACQNAWEDMTGRFTHTVATFLEAYSTVARADLDPEVAEHAWEQAGRVYDALDDLWVADRGVYALREREGSLDDRIDSATLALPGAHLAYSQVGDVDDRRLDRLATHVRTVADGLHRETDAVRGLVRYEGDDWRTGGQNDEKIWTVSTAWGARAAADVATLLVDRERDAGEFATLARDLLSLVLPDGPLCMETGYLPEQVFDDGTPDSATPLGWPHGIRLATVAAMVKRDLLEPAPAGD